MTEQSDFVNDLDVKTEDFEFEYIKGDDTDFDVEGRDSRTTFTAKPRLPKSNPASEVALG